MYWSLCDCILDISHNALHSGAALVKLKIEEQATKLHFLVQDNGRGMTEAEQKLACDPFVSDQLNHPGRQIGLGLPMLIQAIETVQGEFKIESSPGHGTTVQAVFPLSHIDTPPMGDVTSTVCSLLNYRPDIEIMVFRSYCDPDTMQEASYSIKRSELIEVLGELDSLASQTMLRKFIQSQEDWIKGEGINGTNES